MLLKELTEDHYLEAIKLSEYAFQYRVPEASIPKRMELLKKHKMLGVWHEDKLAAKLHIIPLSVQMKEAEWKMGGVAGVATYPEYRRNGYTRALMIEALKQMREDGQIVSLLHPFDIAFYQKFGWEVLSEKKKMTIEKSSLKFFAEQDGFIKRYSKETHNNEIETIYQQFSTLHTGMLKRDTKWWMQSVYGEESQVAVYYDSAQTARGYMLYEIKDSKMTVEEMIVLDHEARVGLWNFICQHDSMVETVTMNLTEHDSLSYLLAPLKVKTEVSPYFMARLVDAEACLKEFPFHFGNNEKESLFLHLEDPHAPWNNGSYLLVDGEIKVFKEKSGSQCAHPPKKGISLSINSLSAILFGYMRPVQLQEMGRLKGSQAEVELFEKMVPEMKSAFIDFF